MIPVSEQYENTPKDCVHADIHYHGMDVSEPGVIYEEWSCSDCGAGVIKVYQPTHQIIDPIDADSFTEEVDV